MKKRRLVLFLLWAFIPMIVVGALVHLCGGSQVQTETNLIKALVVSVLTAGAMLIPFLAVVVTKLWYKEPIWEGLGLSLKFNRWWVIGWLLFPVVAIAILGMSLLMPGISWNSESETIQLALQQMPEGFGPWGIIAISLVSGLFAGATINAVLALGEEIAWRGFLISEFKGMKFMKVSLIIGVIWGFWHFPLILNGHNYPNHPVIGVFMMVLMCVAITPILNYFRQKSASVIVPAIMHGTFNAVVGISNIVVTPLNDLLIGGPGLAGLIVLMTVDVILYLYDRYVSQENIFSKVI